MRKKKIQKEAELYCVKSCSKKELKERAKKDRIPVAPPSRVFENKKRTGILDKKSAVKREMDY